MIEIQSCNTLAEATQSATIDIFSKRITAEINHIPHHQHKKVHHRQIQQSY